MAQHFIRGLFLALLLAVTVVGSAQASTEEVLAKISYRACATATDAVLIVKDGKVIASYGDGKVYMPIDTRSITKTFVSLATGLLTQEERLCGVDAPVYQYYPEWKQGIKKYVTLKHLLSHTSGLECYDDLADCYGETNIIQTALCSDFSTYPAFSFKYNNKGTNLLAGVVQRASGHSIQEYLKGRLFSPLGIRSDTWLCDTFGNHYGMSHLSMSAIDLAKVGMLLAQEGSWNGYNYLSKDWVDFMKTPSQTFTPFYGALLWLGYYTLDLYWDEGTLNMYSANGIPEKYVGALRSLDGCVVRLDGHVNYGNFRQKCAYQLAGALGSCVDVYAFFDMIEAAGLPIGAWDGGHLSSIAARGYGGQQLIVFPDEQLIGVRLSASCTSSGEPDSFADFEDLLVELLHEMDLENAARACYFEGQ